VAPAAIAAARRNAEAAGVAGDIQFAVAEIGSLERQHPAGTLCVNPPYGERIAPRDLEELYRRFADALRRMSGWAAVVLSGNPLLGRVFLKKPVLSHRLWNGPIEVRLLRYEL
jgi:23S rRNA G2445 N2-methylase RlmL